MASFDILYTGKDSAVKIPDFDKLERSESKFYDNIVKGQELKYSEEKANEADFLTAMKTNPVLLISDANRQRQAGALEQYNNEWGSKWAKQGRLSMQDKIKMQSQKEALTMTQNTMLADEKRWQAEKETIDKDIRGFYDKKQFEDATKQFYETGKYPSSGLVAVPQEFVSRLQKIKGHGELRTVTGKGGSTVDYESNMTLDEAKQLVVSELMSNEGSLMRAVKDFNNQPDSEIAKYFEDSNNNGIIDPAEKKSQLDEPKNLNNPILKWAQDFYGNQVRTENPGPSKRPSGSGSGNGFSIGFGGKTIKYNPVDPIDTTIGDRKYKHWNYVRLTGDETNPQYPVSLNKATVLKNTGSGTLNRNTTIQDATLTGFGLTPSGDVEVTFLVPTDNWTKIGLGKGSELSIPISEAPEYGEITVKYEGKNVKLKDLAGTKQTQTSKPKLY